MNRQKEIELAARYAERLTVDQYEAMYCICELQEQIASAIDKLRNTEGVDQRLAAIANSQFELGVMAAIKSIDKENFEL